MRELNTKELNDLKPAGGDCGGLLLYILTGKICCSGGACYQF